MDRVRTLVGADWAHEHNIDGRGVTVVVIDTGISKHEDFMEENGTSRIIGFYDTLHGRMMPYDNNGHGTHISGIIGGSGKLSKGKYCGIAPKCNLVGVKVLNEKGNGSVTDILEGLDWVIKNKERYNIRILNISVGATNPKYTEENSILVRGVNEVWDSGIIVVTAAGNNGPKPHSISAPGISRKVITVGASDDNLSVDLFGSQKSNYSGRGPTQSCIVKPEIIAPGSNIISCNYIRNSPFAIKSTSYVQKSGTSMATPIVSGAIALLLSKYPQLTNKEVKMKLRESAFDLGYPKEKQGWGSLNIEQLLS